MANSRPHMLVPDGLIRRQPMGAWVPPYVHQMRESTDTVSQQFWRNTNKPINNSYFYTDPAQIRQRQSSWSNNFASQPDQQFRWRNETVPFPMRHQFLSGSEHSSSANLNRLQQQRPYSNGGPVTDNSSRRSQRNEPIQSVERTWEYTTLGKLIGSNYDSNSIGDGTRLLIMSYNILAPTLLENHKYLYNDCQADTLNVESRITQFFSEVDEINPDVLCLQEVEADYYDETYRKEFLVRGYKGVFKKRTQDKVDGCAIFYRASTFSLLEKLGVEYHQPNVKILNRDNVGLLVKLQSKLGKKLKFVVGTTHLLYNPKRQDVRMAQMQFMLAELDRFAFCGFGEDKQPKYYPTILSGDFNMEPYSEGVRLITDGKLSSNASWSPAPAANKKIKTDASLPPHFGISDQCQHYKVVSERLKRWKTLKKPNFEIDLQDQKELVHIGSVDLSESSVIKSEQKPSTIGPSVSQRLYPNPLYIGSAEQNDEISIVYANIIKANASSVESKSTVLEDEKCDNGLDTNVLKNINKDCIECTFKGDLCHKFNFKNVYGSQLDRKDHCENIATTKQIGWVCVDYIFYSTVWSKRHLKKVEGNLKLIRRYGLLNRRQCKQMGNMPNCNISSDHFPLVAEFLLKQ